MWAKYWYESVHQSTGFGLDGTKSELIRSKAKLGLSPQQLAAYCDSIPFYQTLRRYAIGVNGLNPGSSVTCLMLSSNPTLTSTGPGASDVIISIKSPLADDRNANLLAWVGDTLLPRHMAKVSVFDSAVQGGDAVWEGLRVYKGRVFKLDKHLQRLFDSAKAMDFKRVPSKSYIIGALEATLAGRTEITVVELFSRF